MSCLVLFVCWGFFFWGGEGGVVGQNVFQNFVFLALYLSLKTKNRCNTCYALPKHKKRMLEIYMSRLQQICFSLKSAYSANTVSVP